jgi:membrane protease subunit HflK
MSLNDPRWGGQGGNDGAQRRQSQRRNRGDTATTTCAAIAIAAATRDRPTSRRSGAISISASPACSAASAGVARQRRWRRRGRRPPQLPSFSFKQFGGGIGVLLALVIVVWLASGFYTVDANQRGVVLRLGEYVETTEPGLRWRLPARSRATRSST